MNVINLFRQAELGARQKITGTSGRRGALGHAQVRRPQPKGQSVRLPAPLEFALQQAICRCLSLNCGWPPHDHSAGNTHAQHAQVATWETPLASLGQRVCRQPSGVCRHMRAANKARQSLPSISMLVPLPHAFSPSSCRWRRAPCLPVVPCQTLF